MHNSHRLTKGSERYTLLMHPDDAQVRALVDNDKVRVKSKVGEVILPLQITDEMMPGMVSITHTVGDTIERIFGLIMLQQMPG